MRSEAAARQLEKRLLPKKTAEEELLLLLEEATGVKPGI
jgi:hypothetical protein